MVKDPKGAKIVYDSYHMDDFKDADPAAYEKVNQMLLSLGKDAQSLVK
jgi:hypothetical protein